MTVIISNYAFCELYFVMQKLDLDERFQNLFGILRRYHRQLITTRLQVKWSILHSCSDCVVTITSHKIAVFRKIIKVIFKRKAVYSNIRIHDRHSLPNNPNPLSSPFFFSTQLFISVTKSFFLKSILDYLSSLLLLLN